MNEKDELQVAQYLRKLNCPTYLGEFIKRLITNYIEKNPSKEPKFDIIHKIINYLKAQDIIAQDDVIDGISKVTKRLEDISLDCPYFKEQFDILSKELIKC